jgi:2,4-dienoyl-CoA reductase-like NADH-dependent reductase (Old Yellow Enzyme family)
MAVGLIVDGHQAEAVVANEHADIVAIGREALVDPNFPLHAEAQLNAADPANPYKSWPVQITWWLQGRANQIKQIAAAALA